MDLIEQIDRWGHDAPERVAHVSGGRALTYGELTRQSDAVAAHLDRVLGDDSSPVAVLGHKEPEMLVAFLGAVKAGHAYVPIDTSQVATPCGARASRSSTSSCGRSRRAREAKSSSPVRT